MTREEYTERARQLCNLVNVRRVQVGREALREEHIMRAVRVIFGSKPLAKISWGHARFSTSGIPINAEKVAEWQSIWREKYAHRWLKTPMGLVPA